MPRVFITNQVKLADIVGCSPQHLSAFKGGKTGISEELVNSIEEITHIKRILALNQKSLKKKLTAFFVKEKQEEKLFMKQRRTHAQSGTAISCRTHCSTFEGDS